MDLIIEARKYMYATSYYELVKHYASLGRAGVLGFFLDNSG